MIQPPSILDGLKEEFANWPRWRDRLVVMVFAALSGLLVVAFTLCSEWALDTFFYWQSKATWAAFVISPIICVVVVWITQRYFASTAGSGIPQVIAALSAETPVAKRGFFISFKLSIAKLGLTTAGLLGGLSLGREGPSVQIAAGMMRNARHWLSAHSQIKESGLILAGGAAGIAAAFNTPLGGVMFAIEELSRHPEDRRNGILITAIVLSGLVAVSIFGNATYFGEIRGVVMGWQMILPSLVVALLCGVLGGIFSRMLIASLNPLNNHFLSRFRLKRPLWFACAIGLLLALIGFVTQDATFGSGYAHTRAMLEHPGNESFTYPFFKMLATWLTTWSGVPGGIFAPSLAVGAALGHDVAVLWNSGLNTPTLMAVGMAAFLAAVTQAPLTAFIIVMEMVSGHELVLSLMLSALVASTLSRLISMPLYTSLASFQLRRLHAVQAASHARPPLERS